MTITTAVVYTVLLTGALVALCRLRQHVKSKRRQRLATVHVLLPLLEKRPTRCQFCPGSHGCEKSERAA